MLSVQTGSAAQGIDVMQREKRPIMRALVTLLSCCILAPLATCTPDALGPLASPTADFAPGGQIVERAILVGFVNNTNFRAIFTYGAYNPLDKDTIPTNFGQLRLEANTSSAQIAQPCRATFSVGGDELIRLVNLHEGNPNITITDDRALVRGVYFSGAPLGDPLAAEPTEGTAAGSVGLVGVDFTCNRPDIADPIGTGLLIYTFEQDAAAPGGFRIDYSFIQP